MATPTYSYYSVTKPMKINGQKRVPCICYALPKSMADGIAKLAAQGGATLYETPVRFQSGKVLPANPDIPAKPIVMPPAGITPSAPGDVEFPAESGS